MDKKAKLENIKLNKAGYFECNNYCNICQSYNCKLLKQARGIVEKNGEIIRG
jgi:hypothetical protein